MAALWERNWSLKSAVGVMVQPMSLQTTSDLESPAREIGIETISDINRTVLRLVFREGLS